MPSAGHHSQRRQSGRSELEHRGRQPRGPNEMQLVLLCCVSSGRSAAKPARARIALHTGLRKQLHLHQDATQRVSVSLENLVNSQSHPRLQAAPLFKATSSKNAHNPHEPPVQSRAAVSFQREDETTEVADGGALTIRPRRRSFRPHKRL